jgi:aminopeptidase N
VSVSTGATLTPHLCLSSCADALGYFAACRDWFQLTLKEGLTVFRDQEFSSDLNSRAVIRIENVLFLRGRQFNEDASP